MNQLRRGQRPSVNDYAEQYPDLAEQIRELFPALLMMESLVPDESEVGSPKRSSVDRSRLSRIGDYLVTREIGRGGMGVVFEAEQLSLKRQVALKILNASTAENTRALERFRLEAQAAARLHHANIVPVYDEVDPNPWAPNGVV